MSYTTYMKIEHTLNVHIHLAESSVCLVLNELLNLKTIGETIMSAISDFAEKQNAHNDQIDAAISGLTEDVKTLNDLIATLQASQGSITPEDQATLDDLQARSQVIADKLTALDALTPPPAPAEAV